MLYYKMYTYDGDGALVTAMKEEGTTVYIGGYYEELVPHDSTPNTIRKYYSANGQKVAMRENGVLSYLLGDHLGSTSIQMDDVGNVLAEQRYLPFGGVCFTTGNMSTDYRYTGQREESELGLYDYKARWYDPVLGRFIQPDTLVPNPGNPMAYNRYAYVMNNPMRYTDPSGHRSLEPQIDGVCGGVGCWEQGNTQKNGETVAVQTNNVNESDYSDWYAGKYSGCTMCHYARAYSKSILNNQELAQADQNIREWAAIGYTPMIITTAGVGAAEVVNLVVVSSLSVSTVELACADGDCSNEVRTGTNVVYRGFNRFGEQYIGITNNFSRRFGEHYRNGIVIDRIPGLEHLSRIETRSVEQVLINHYGLSFITSLRTNLILVECG